MTRRSGISRLTGDAGMLGVLGLLCVLISLLTIHDQRPEGARAARALARVIRARGDATGGVLIVARASRDDSLFARTLRDELAHRNIAVAGVVQGEPAGVRAGLAALRTGAET